MPTRSGRTFSVGETFTPMDPNLQDTLNTIIDKMKKMDNYMKLKTKLMSVVGI